MKKVILLLLSISLFTACENEPIDSALFGTENPTGGGQTGGGGTGGGTGGGGSESNDLTLSSYSFNTETEAPIIGNTIVDTDFVMGNNKVVTLNINSVFFGTNVTGSGTLERDGSGRLSALKAFQSGMQVSETTISYTGNDISTIVYDDFEDDTEDYTYTFTTNGNVISRTSSVSDITVEYTFNGSNQLTKKESMDSGSILQTELLTYDANGNCTNVNTTGENENATTYGFDSFTTPLKEAFSDQFLFNILEASYSTEAGSSIVQFFSTNNWNSITTSEGTLDFNMQYNSANRIESRIGSYILEEGVTIDQEELYNYVN